MDLLLGPSPAALDILLEDPDEHEFPATRRVLGGLSADLALAVPPGSPYSIAQLLAHMDYWVRFNLEKIAGREPAPPQGWPAAPDGAWPAVSAEGWPALVEGYLANLEALRAIARAGTDLERVLDPATESEPGWSVGYRLASVAKHNDYHLGQIVLLRRMLGAWTPDSL